MEEKKSKEKRTDDKIKTSYTQARTTYRMCVTGRIQTIGNVWHTVGRSVHGRLTGLFFIPLWEAFWLPEKTGAAVLLPMDGAEGSVTEEYRLPYLQSSRRC